MESKDIRNLLLIYFNTRRSVSKFFNKNSDLKVNVMKNYDDIINVLFLHNVFPGGLDLNVIVNLTKEFYPVYGASDNKHRIIASRFIDYWESRKIVERRLHKNDKRKIKIVFTPSGKDILKRFDKFLKDNEPRIEELQKRLLKKIAP